MSIEELYILFSTSKGVTTDTRNCKKGSLFFALKGEHFNGNLFADKAIANGASHAIVDELHFAPHTQYIRVEDVLKTLSELATYHRRKLNKPVIAITGTNGKTTTKELIATALSQQYNVCFTQGNFNNHIGVPLTLLEAKSTHEILIIEMGANHPGEITHLCKIAEPNFGLITNIGIAHLDGFGSEENIIKTKKELYNYILNTSGKIFINNEDALLSSISTGIESIHYGTDFKLTLTKQDPFLWFRYCDRFNEQIFKTHFIGGYNTPNFYAAISIANYFKVPTEKALKALETYIPGNNRSQLKTTEKNTLILDAYNSNPSSLTEAIHNFTSLNHSKKLLILGDMKELGEYSIEEHQKITDLISTQKELNAILVGSEFAQTKTADSNICFPDITSTKAHLEQAEITDTLILLKGSRSMKLEELIPYL